jgi:crotonobetainyl-CoA:carnitine CoA-transferase CaiB-like acyl-CoA transferase
LSVAVTTDAHWDALAACVGAAELGDLRFTDAASRARHDEELGARCSRPHFASRSAVPSSTGRACRAKWPTPIPVDLFDDPDLVARGWTVSYPHPARRAPSAGPPPRGAVGDPRPHRSAATDVGQHTRELLAEHGYQSEEIDELLDAGVVAQT